MEPVVVVGRTCVGDFCHVPVTMEGVPCFSLVDTGSTVTLVRPDIVPDWTQFEPTTVQLHTVTGELAPMKGSEDSDSRGQVCASSFVGSACAGPLYPGIGLS